MEPLVHLPSKRSISLIGIRYVDWDREESGTDNVGTRIYWKRTYIYYHNSSEPIIFTENVHPTYATDVGILKNLLGFPEETTY
jgi:hypothetical protein